MCCWIWILFIYFFPLGTAHDILKTARTVVAYGPLRWGFLCCTNKVMLPIVQKTNRRIMKQDQPWMLVSHLLLQTLVLILGQDVWPEAKGGKKFSLDVKKSLPKRKTISKINKAVMEASLLQVNCSFPHKDWQGATQRMLTGLY